MLKDNQLTIRKAFPCESREIEQLHKKAFGTTSKIPSIFSSIHISRYIFYVISESLYQQESEKNLFFVAHIAENLAGYLQAKILDTQNLHINYIAVDPKFQNQGIGRALFAYLKNYFEQFEIKKLTLDVEQSNDIAYQWYRKFGFETKYHTYNYCRSINEFPVKECSFKVINWLDSEAWQYTYGFSMVKLSIGSSDILNIGRLSNHYWRINDSNYLNNTGLTYVLKVLDKNRPDLLISSKTKPKGNSACQEIVFRMEKLLK